MPPYAALLTSALALASLAAQQSELRQRIETFSADLADLNRRYDTPMSAERRDRLRRRFQDELRAPGLNGPRL